MNEAYLTIADGFEKLAAGYRALAGTDSVPAENEATSVEEASADVTDAIDTTDATEITLQDLLAVVSEKLNNGKRLEVKDLLLRYDSSKVSEVKESDYPDFLAEARAL